MPFEYNLKIETKFETLFEKGEDISLKVICLFKVFCPVLLIVLPLQRVSTEDFLCEECAVTKLRYLHSVSRTVASYKEAGGRLNSSLQVNVNYIRSSVLREHSFGNSRQTKHGMFSL